ncbi:MAG: hypothetical protein A2782_03020 [Candidatus Blackburnbacteria bacterium RIFCSPHIGHO2_01_FULL_43_15b]|uniref:Uncharacterized protein n=1 Tax=Candidatus Blackburnbacteria bacterium RIFCSPHIGHO2_01_FULL_43_15b TaxID=1797513 RepID=A0A1G1V2N2_9BACT|nr:MAG: hypothetical protein A2782_03020 [Candidatus Blackburnbacteria bacterium RIFCSPHIGHO2_01_FULL_43_15b]
MHFHQKVALLVALAAPTLLVALIAGSIFIPQLFVSPKTDFLYFIGDDYSCSNQYVVKNKRVVKSGASTSSSSGVVYQPCVIRDLNDGKIKEIHAGYLPQNNHCLDERPLTPDDKAVLEAERGRWSLEPEPCYTRNSYAEYDNIGRIARYQLVTGEHCMTPTELSGYECFVSGPQNEVKKVELSTLDIGYFCLSSQNLTPEQMTEAREAYSKGFDPFNADSSCKKADIYIHSVKTNKSIQLKPEQAQQYNLNASLKSPEGYEVIQGAYGGFPFRGYPDNHKYYFLKGKNIAKKLNLEYSENNGYKPYYFNFLGWVEQQ